MGRAFDLTVSFSSSDYAVPILAQRLLLNMRIADISNKTDTQGFLSNIMFHHTAKYDEDDEFDMYDIHSDSQRDYTTENESKGDLELRGTEIAKARDIEDISRSGADREGVISVCAGESFEHSSTAV